MAISIMLVDDHQMLLEGLKALLESEEDMKVIAQAETGEKAIQLGLELKPNIIVMDLGLPDMNGVSAIKAIHEKNRESHIIVLSMYSNKEVVMQSIEAGCDGYVPKSSAHTDLVDAIHTVMGGKRFLHPTAATALVESLTSNQPPRDQFESLSSREQEVIKLSVRGFNGREIGDQLFLSAKTVETYRQRAMRKLGLQHRSDLIEFAVKAGLMEE
jgi:two-component system response regulator NreC